MFVSKILWYVSTMTPELELTVLGDKRIVVPPRLLLEVASGLEEGWEIADRYGYSDREWKEMSENEGFKKQVAALTAELKLNGVTFQRKAAMIAEDLLEDLFALAKNSRSLPDLLSVARFAASMGRLEPVSGDRSGGQTGNVFQIAFNFQGGVKPPAVLQVTNDVLAQINADLGLGDDEGIGGVVRTGR